MKQFDYYSGEIFLSNRAYLDFLKNSLTYFLNFLKMKTYARKTKNILTL